MSCKIIKKIKNNMGCNCKVSGDGSKIQEKLEPKSLPQNILKYTAKIIGFIIGIVLLPLIVLGIIWFMFDIIVLNKDVDLSILLKKIVKINKAIMEDDEENDDDDDNDDFDELEDYITENVEEIKE